MIRSERIRYLPEDWPVSPNDAKMHPRLVASDIFAATWDAESAAETGVLVLRGEW